MSFVAVLATLMFVFSVPPAAAPAVAIAVPPVNQTLPQASPTPAAADQVAPLAIDDSTAPQPVVVKDIDMAPPTWMQDLLVSVKSLPVIGPIITKAIQWLAVVCSIVTALCAFLLVVLRALATVLTLAKLTDLAQKLEAFQNSRVMYYLKYASMFNAKKPAPKAGGST